MQDLENVASVAVFKNKRAGFGQPLGETEKKISTIRDHILERTETRPLIRRLELGCVGQRAKSRFERRFAQTIRHRRDVDIPRHQGLGDHLPVTDNANL